LFLSGRMRRPRGGTCGLLSTTSIWCRRGIIAGGLTLTIDQRLCILLLKSINMPRTSTFYIWRQIALRCLSKTPHFINSTNYTGLLRSDDLKRALVSSRACAERAAVIAQLVRVLEWWLSTGRGDTRSCAPRRQRRFIAGAVREIGGAIQDFTLKIWAL
jgi:hypothetical protein